jgi:hypothetical protein
MERNGLDIPIYNLEIYHKDILGNSIIISNKYYIGRYRVIGFIMFGINIKINKI